MHSASILVLIFLPVKGILANEKNLFNLHLDLFFFPSETVLEKEGIKGSRLEVTLEYTALKHVEISSRTDEKEFMEKYNMNEPVNEGINILLLENIPYIELVRSCCRFF